MSDQDLEETYLPAFHRIVDAGAGGVMCSYNAINGVPSCVNSQMLRYKLRGDFGFQGMVATDCGALNDADTKHNYSTAVCPSCNTTALRGEKIAQLALKAGVDSNCGSFMGEHMPAVMQRRMVPQSTLQESTARLLTIRFKLGLFEPNNAAVPKFGLEHVDSAAHRTLALKQARQAIVLLQNRPFIPPHNASRRHRRGAPDNNGGGGGGAGGGVGGTDMSAAVKSSTKADAKRTPNAPTKPKPILPLRKGSKVAMIGPNANATLNLLSGYHGTPPFLVSPLLALQRALGKENVRYAMGCNVTNVSWGGIGGGAPGRPPPGAPPPPSLSAVKAHIAAAVALAKSSDVAVVGLGLCGDNYWGGGNKEDGTCFAIQETETTDRLDLNLPGWQLPLLQAVVATGVPVVLFVINAGPVDLSWAKEHVAAIISAGYPGEQGGQGIADVLTGAYNPGGALAYTLHTQRFAAQTPYDSMEMRPNKTNGSPGRTYRFFETGLCADCVSWPFGFGGSYTTFEMAWTAPPPTTVNAGDDTIYELTVTNTGTVVGDVVVTCYVRAVKESVAKAGVHRPPVQQLFAFERVEELPPSGSMPTVAAEAAALSPPPPSASALVAFTLTPEGRTLVTDDGRRVAAAGDYQVVCKAGGGTIMTEAALTVV